MSVSKATAIVMFSGTLFLSAITQAQTSSSPMGNWQIAKVSINNQAQRTLEYQHDDDRLVGRFVTVSPASIVADLPGGVNCQSPVFSQHDKKMNDWITDVFGQGDDASAENYRLGIAGTENAKISTVECKTGAFTTGDSDHNADFVFVENKVFLNWTDGTLLTLMPADENAKPVASFNCDKAESDTEKAICGNRTLASLDTSVSRSYSWYRQEAARLDNRELQTKLVTQQKAWLKQRNACASDATCLQKSMQNRLESLSHSLDAF
jgi:uncharacterized protein YecT (DUF1311 family)